MEKRWMSLVVFSLMMPAFMVGPAIMVGAADVFSLLIVDSQLTEPYSTVKNAMLQELGELGYREGDNLTITSYSIGNIEGKAKRIWKDERSNAHHVIFVNGTLATKSFKDLALDDGQHTFVFAAVTDPVGVGVIDDFKQSPSHNFTGVCYPVPVKERFNLIRQVMPAAQKVGLVYADMPQSHSYRAWVEDLLANDPDFRDMDVIFRQVPFVKTEEGYKRMVKEAKAVVAELDAQVDVFLTPNDQMGVQEAFARMVADTAGKPLVGLSGKDVMEGWGATMAVYSSQESAGRQVALMIKRLFEGESVKDIIPEWPKESGVALDLKKIEQFGFTVPEELLEKAGENVVR